MAYLTIEQLQDKGFLYLGQNVLISDKASIFNPELISIGNDSRIDDFCVISGKLSIGSNVHITAQCLIAGGLEGIYIDDFCAFAYQVKIFSQSDDYSGLTMTNSTVPSLYKKEIKKSINIGKHVIIGAGSTVLPGVNIGEGCSIGSMSLVNKDTNPWGIYFGSPAKRFKDRKTDLLSLEKKFIKAKFNDSI